MRRAPVAAVVGHRLGLISLPVFHREGVGHDSRARTHIENLRPEFHVDGRQKEHRDDLRLREVGLVEVRLDEGRLVGHPCSGRIPFGELDHVRVVFDAHCTGTALCGGNHGAAVTRSEIDDEILRRDLRHVEHFLDENLRRWHPDHVFACLADLWLIRLGCRLRIDER
jgi:hypothetical protein